MPYDEALAYYEIGRHATDVEKETNLARAMKSSSVWVLLGLERKHPTWKSENQSELDMNLAKWEEMVKELMK